MTHTLINTTDLFAIFLKATAAVECPFLMHKINKYFPSLNIYKHYQIIFKEREYYIHSIFEIIIIYEKIFHSPNLRM